MLQLMEGIGGGRRGSRLLCCTGTAVFAVVNRSKECSLVSLLVRVNLRECSLDISRGLYLSRKYFVSLTTM